MKLANLYAQVTSTIVAELEMGAIPWTKPWRNTAPVGNVMPHNAATNRPYSGINIPILWGAALTSGYDRHLWMTYKQALAAGARVRGGEHGTTVVFTKKLKSDVGSPTYGGPCPPPGSPHHYTFLIIATDLDPKDLPPGLTVAELQAKLAGHEKGAAGLVGSYVNPYPN